MTRAADEERGTEIELKLDLDDEGAASLGRLPILASLSPDEQEQRTTYFDTPEHDLRAAGVSLRVRQTGDRFVQTIKAASAAAAGVFARPEWERDVAGPAPDLGLGSPLRAMVDEALLAQLQPAFTIVVTRRRWLVETPGAAVELVLDQGMVRAGGAQSDIREIEVELKHGPPEALFSLGRTMAAAIPVRLGVLTKADRGYHLLDGTPDKAVKAEAVALDPDETVADAFAAIAGACLRQFRRNEDLFRAAPAPDALHQTRVALRRLRSALSLFKPVLADARFPLLAGELRHLARSLGLARDLDVLIERLGGAASDEIRAARAAAYDDARAALDSQRTRDLMLAIVEWIAVGDWRARPADPAILDQPATDYAAGALRRLRRRIKKRGAYLADLDDDDRHKVRILTKKLRYATDFFAGLFTGKKAQRRHKAFSKKLTALQKHLGSLNDLATAPTLLTRFGLDQETIDPDARDRLLRKAAKAQKSLVKAKRFW